MAKDEKESTAYDFPKDMPKYLADKKKRAADQKAKKQFRMLSADSF